MSLLAYDKPASIPFQAAGVMEAEVYSTDSRGWVYVKIPRQTGNLVRGPFPILMTPRDPSPGDMCLVGFMEGRPDEVIVLGLFGRVTSVTMGTCVVYNVADYGVVANAASAATANVTALASVETAVQSAGCGIIYFPCGTYYFDGAASAVFLTVDSDNVTLAAEAGIGSTLHDLRTGAGTLIKFSGSSGNYISNCAVRDLKFTGANTGANSRKSLELVYVEGLRVDRSEFSDTAWAIWGDDVRDIVVNFTRFERCSVSDASNKGAVYFSSNSGASKLSRSARFTSCLWKDCYQHDVFLEGVTTPVAHFRFNDCRFQNDAYVRGDRVRLSVVENISFNDCEWSIGDFNTGYTTKVNGISIEGTSRAVSFMNNFFESQDVVASASATVSAFIYAGTGSDDLTGLTMVGNNFSLGTNHALAQGCIRYGTAVSKVFRAGNRIVEDAGTGVLEVGSPVNLSSRGVATLGQLNAPARSVSSNTTVTEHDDLILANANSASVNITVPALASSPYRIAVKKTDSSANIVRVTVTSATIEGGGTTLDLLNQYEVATLVHDGTNWWIT